MTDTSGRSRRGQANLVALAVGLILLTTVTVAGVVVADGALAGADRTPVRRHAAVALADRLVAADSAVAYRSNVLNGSALDGLTAERLDRLAPPVAGRPVSLRLDGETLVSRGDPVGGTTVARAVVVGTRTDVSRTVDLSAAPTLSRRASALRIRVDPGSNTTVHTVRVNDRIVLYDPGGLSGTATVDTSRLANATVSFGTNGNYPGTATVSARPVDATAARLEVTVGA